MAPGEIKKKGTFVADLLLSRRLPQRGITITIITQRSRPKQTYTGSIRDVVLRRNERERCKQRSVKHLKTSKHRKGWEKLPGENKR